jgi:hypothetical protein
MVSQDGIESVRGSVWMAMTSLAFLCSVCYLLLDEMGVSMTKLSVVAGGFVFYVARGNVG